MHWVLIGGGAVAAVYGLAVAVLFLLQRRILFRPNNTPPELERSPIAGVRPLTVTTRDGLALLAWYMPPPPREGARVVLYLHGNAGHIGHRACRLAPFNRIGWGVLLLEYRGFGGNPGHPSEPALLIDARAGLTALEAMGFPPHRILLWGESLGSGLAVRLAVEQTVAAVLLEAPYTSIVELARRRFPYVPVGWLLLDRFDTMRAIGHVRAPVLVMHGGRDQIIPVAMGRAVYDAAPEPKELWIMPEADHFNLVEVGAIETAADFVKRWDRAAGSSSRSDECQPHNV